MGRIITKELFDEYGEYMLEEEKSEATIEKYMRDLKKLEKFASGRSLTKSLVIEYKNYLKDAGDYKTSSINSFLIAANRFFEYMQWYDLKVKTFRLQKPSFLPEKKELTKEEYKRLIDAANEQKKTKLGLLIQTICATGIRVGELCYITVDSVKSGMVSIFKKGKLRQILIPKKLQDCLKAYISANKIKSGPVFQTSSGRPLDRSYIGKEIKKLCKAAKVEKTKAFPHNLRHLFARTFYSACKDIAKLADILGHGNIETTRIYLMESAGEHRKQLDEMNLVLEE